MLVCVARMLDPAGILAETRGVTNGFRRLFAIPAPFSLYRVRCLYSLEPDKRRGNETIVHGKRGVARYVMSVLVREFRPGYNEEDPFATKVILAEPLQEDGIRSSRKAKCYMWEMERTYYNIVWVRPGVTLPENEGYNAR